MRGEQHNSMMYEGSTDDVQNKKEKRVDRCLSDNIKVVQGIVNIGDFLQPLNMLRRSELHEKRR
jgi:hypothetical protein